MFLHGSDSRSSPYLIESGLYSCLSYFVDYPNSHEY